MWYFVYSTLVAVDEGVHMYPDIRPAKEFAAIEQRAQQRITIVEEMWQQERAVQQTPHPTLREEEDDWSILLDVAPKKSGIIQWDLDQNMLQTLLFEFVLQCTVTL